MAWLAIGHGKEFCDFIIHISYKVFEIFYTKTLTLVYLNTPYSILKLKAFLIVKRLISFRSNIPNIQGDYESHSAMSLCYPMSCRLPSSSVHGILQARKLEWVAIPFFRGLSWPRNGIWVSYVSGRFFTIYLQWRYRNI